jgi:hypothetical protein
MGQNVPERARKSVMPDFLSHYYESTKGPFLNLSDLSLTEAEAILDKIRQDGLSFASKRASDYLKIRQSLEDQVRRLFMEKGGKPRREKPHCMILGACPWLKEWYVNGREIRIPLTHFNQDVVSFTYGDTFPAMRFQDGKPYRGQVYTLAELPEIIHLYGLPQDWNIDGKRGPDRYIEAQVWDDEPIRQFLRKVTKNANPSRFSQSYS